MKKALMLSAMAVGAIATLSSAQAKKSGDAYTFGTSGGGAYCNGITFGPSTYVTGAFEGIGTYNSACANYYTPTGMGGFAGPLRALGKGKWYTFTGTPGAQGLPTNYILIDYLNTKSLFWYLAYEASATSYYSAIPFEIINEGPLLVGAPEARAGKVSKTPSWSVAMEKVKAARKVQK